MRTSPGCDPHATLAEIERLALEAGCPEIAAEGRALDERLAEGRFFVVCVGQFKRGKSTLLNALVGHAVLPTGVVPVTSAITVLRHGERLGARVRFADGSWRETSPQELANYVTEAANPGNEKGVVAVEVFVPSPLLASGLCLVDTPGLGSVFAGNSAATRAFLPHIDAALLVVGVDPPLGREELDLAAAIAGQVEHVAVVVNKADRHPEADRREARAFAARILQQRLGRAVEPLLEVSATERLARARPSYEWQALEAFLRGLADASGARLVDAAAARGIGRLVTRLLAAIEEQHQAFVRPLEESEGRVQTYQRLAAESDIALRDLGARLTAEHERLVRVLGAHRESHVRDALPRAYRHLDEALAGYAGEAPALRRYAMEAARRIARDAIDAWLASEETTAQGLYAEAMRRFVDLANELLRRLAAAAGPAALRLAEPLEEEPGLRARRQFFMTDLMAVAPESTWGALFDRFRPAALRLRAVRRAARLYLERLLDTNSTRVQNDLIERARQSRQRLETEIRGRISEAHEVAARALARAREAHAAGADAVRAELDRLDYLKHVVAALTDGQRAEAGRAG